MSLGVEGAVVPERVPVTQRGPPLGLRPRLECPRVLGGQEIAGDAGLVHEHQLRTRLTHDIRPDIDVAQQVRVPEQRAAVPSRVACQQAHAIRAGQVSEGSRAVSGASGQASASVAGGPCSRPCSTERDRVRRVLGVDGGQSGIRLRHSSGALVSSRSRVSAAWRATPSAAVAGAIAQAWRRGGFEPVDRAVLGLTTAPTDAESRRTTVCAGRAGHGMLPRSGSRTTRSRPTPGRCPWAGA